VTTEQDPFARVYDVEDDDFAHDHADEDLFGRDEFGFEEFGCHFPDRCCMPGPHFPSECVSVEMMEELFAEAEMDSEDPGPAGRPTPDPEEGPF
jgi:hypothetical protein